MEDIVIELQNDFDIENNDFTNLAVTTINNNNNSDDFQMIYIHSNSPVSTAHNSDEENDAEYAQNSSKLSLTISDDGKKTESCRGYKKKNFHDIERTLSKYYECEKNTSNKLDLLITFIKGQKQMYLRCNNITQYKLYAMVIPILLFSAGIAIFAPIIQDYEWSGGFISGLNVIINCLISIMSYMKYESNADKYLLFANHYDRMENLLEMASSDLLFIEDETEKRNVVFEKMKQVETTIKEVKQLDNVLLPKEAFHLYPIFSTINIFSLIKKMETHHKVLIHNFKDIKNEIELILYKWKSKSVSQDSAEHQKQKNRLLYLYDSKEKMKQELLESNKIYGIIDRLFSKEIKNAQQKKWIWYFFRYNKHAIQSQQLHPIIQKYFEFIFEE
jgi:hypothetical protein